MKYGKLNFIYLLLAVTFSGCKNGFYLKKDYVTYKGGSFANSDIIGFKPYHLYFEIDQHFVKDKYDSLNYRQKFIQFDSLYRNFLSFSKIDFKTDSTIFNNSKPFLNGYRPPLQGLFHSLRETIVTPVDNKVYITGVVRFIRSLNVGSVTVPSPYLKSELTFYLLVFKNNKLIHSRVYFNDVNDGFPTIYPDGRVTGVKPYFQEAQMKDVIEKSMRDFMKHVKVE